MVAIGQFECVCSHSFAFDLLDFEHLHLASIADLVIVAMPIIMVIILIEFDHNSSGSDNLSLGIHPIHPFLPALTLSVCMYAMHSRAKANRQAALMKSITNDHTALYFSRCLFVCLCIASPLGQ